MKYEYKGEVKERIAENYIKASECVRFYYQHSEIIQAVLSEHLSDEVFDALPDLYYTVCDLPFPSFESREEEDALRTLLGNDFKKIQKLKEVRDKLYDIMQSEKYIDYKATKIAEKIKKLPLTEENLREAERGYGALGAKVMARACEILREWKEEIKKLDKLLKEAEEVLLRIKDAEYEDFWRVLPHGAEPTPLQDEARKVIDRIKRFQEALRRAAVPKLVGMSGIEFVEYEWHKVAPNEPYNPVRKVYVYPAPEHRVQQYKRLLELKDEIKAVLDRNRYVE